MSTVYSKALLETASTAGDQGITPAAGFVLIVREIYVTQSSIVPVDFNVTGSAGQILYGGSMAIAGDTNSVWERHIVVGPGGQLAVHSGVAPIDLSIYGYELTI
jgi:hypothetical protein